MTDVGRPGPQSQTVTVLFTDLVGSTELLAGLGAGGDALRRSHFAALRRALVATRGEEVKSLGDGVMAVFHSTVDAVSCAVAMQQATARMGRRHPEHTVAVRIGVSVGEATPEGDDWFGAPVVEAARLCGAAEGGQILVSSLVADLVGSRGGHRFTDVGALALKGLPQPVPTRAVTWQETGAVPLPLPFRAVERSPFVGRDGARARLDEAWAEARAGGRRAVFVGGEPGIGKTRLVSELARAVHAAGATVLYGRSDEELGAAYQPFAEALRHYITGCDPAELAAHVQAHGSHLARLVPELARRLPDLPPPPALEPEADRIRLFEAVDGLIAKASEEAPVLLVLDDLHWAGKPTLLLLCHLLRATDPAAVLVAATYRDTEPARVQPLAGVLADLRRLRGVDYLSLVGLDEAGVRAYVEASAGHPLDEASVALSRVVRAETDGNPFFLGEVLRHLVETGAVRRQEGMWQVGVALDQIGIPDSVRDVVGGRLSRLSPAANRALRVASVIGADFSLDLLERADDASSPEDVLDGLDEGVRARLVSEVPGRPGRYAFAHSLVRHSLYDGLTATRRARLHARVAEALEGLHGSGDGPHLAAVAHHFAEAATVGQAEKAADYALRAAERAMAQVAHEEAAAVLERGLEALAAVEPADQRRRAELLLKLAHAHAQALDHEAMRKASLEAAEAARAAGSAAHLARAAYWYNARAIAGTRDEAGIGLCEEALAALGDNRPALRSTVLATLALHLSFAGEGIGADPLSREAIALAQEAGDPDALALAQRSRYYTLWGSPHAEDQLVLAEQLMTSQAVTPSGLLASTDAYRLRAIPRLIVGDLAGFDADAAEIERLGDELKSKYFLGLAAQWHTLRALLEGRFDEVEALSAMALNFAGDDPNFLNSFAAQMFHLRREQGRLAELEPILVSIVERNPGIPGFRAALAVTRVELHDLDAAGAEFEALAVDDFAGLSRNLLWPASLVLLSEAATALGDEARAATLLGLLAPYSGQLVVVGGGSYCPGAADRYLAMLEATLGRLDEAEGHYRAALELEGRIDSGPLCARSRYWYARTLLDRGRTGDRERAAELLDAVVETARVLGMGGLAAQAAAAQAAWSDA